ncbi:golgin subfamily A member 2-like isoform X2 [Gigantopelta aegis]|uniref:golgin subfamily A member 2-like isoform X2 n=1 Tax=Gigantopelta aegis TaxID=1735272 RepID=UPI001B888C70|nr:golgin subfamily A member 2-like isoform X2 [Gigantopelta aegis]
MADSLKQEKIAAAKKRLKQFQQKSGRSPSNSSTQPSKTSVSRNNTKKDSSSSSKSVETGVTSEKTECKSSDCALVPTTESADSRLSAKSVKTNSELPSNEHCEWYNSSRATSSTESLQQLSRQINGLLAESQEYINGEDMESSSISELEKRNRELASYVETASQSNEQLSIQIDQVRDHAKHLQDQLDKERESFEEKHRKEIGALKEQLQVHIQTIGILVAEKTELQSQVGQSQRIAVQRLDEIEELSGRLKASRQRVADLERNLSSSSQSSQQLEKSSREYAKDVDRLKMELYRANKSKEELQLQTQELGGKLSAKVAECSQLEQSVGELSKKLEMAELYAKQLSTESESSAESVQLIQQLQQEKNELSSKIHQYEESFQTVTSERDQLSDQYKQYVEQLKHQLEEVSNQVSILTHEREKVISQNHELEGSLSELKKKIEEYDLQQPTTDIPSESLEEMNRLKTEYSELQARHEAQIRDNAQLSRFLQEKEDHILSLESTISHLGAEAGDKASLLESVQSDKTALSRALTQNKDLKRQLAELQNGFVKLSNDNMELLTTLQGKEHTTIELTQKLAQQEDELKNQKQLMLKKDAELSQLYSMTENVKKEEFQQDQIQDRLRHYEAQAQLVDTLQNELTSAQDMMDALTTQNRELRTMLIKATEVKMDSDNSDETDMGKNRDEVIDSLSSTIRQLENERVQLIDSLREQRELSDSFGVKVADLQEEIIRKTQDNLDNDIITRADYDQLKTAMEMVQEKYSKVMRDKADLSDKADQLEHMVTQLQGETDTIGEYISLYHHQRALLQQRESQKNEYIVHLDKDRQEMQLKLGQLQSLVMQLLGERNMLNSYNEETQRSPESKHIPHHHNHANKAHTHKYPHQLVNGGADNSYNDWPDYTSSESDTESEVETIVGGAEGTAVMQVDGHRVDSDRESAAGYGDQQETVPNHTDMGNKHELTAEGEQVGDHAQNHKHVHYHHHENHVPRPLVSEEDQTAHRILNLLSEIGHSSMVEKPPFMDRNFLPCKFCTGPVYVV